MGVGTLTKPFHILLMDIYIFCSLSSLGNELKDTDKLIYLANISRYVRNILSNGSALVETILPR